MATSQDNVQIRQLDQEPDCIALIPISPEHVIVGTYSLEKTEDETPAARKGSLQILPFSSISTSTEVLYRKEFPYGIYDIQFHPSVSIVGKNEPCSCSAEAINGESRCSSVLMGVATSAAEILLLNLEQHDQIFEMRCFGRVQVEEPRNGQLSIVTQLAFQKATDHVNEGVWIMLAAATQFGNIKLMKVLLPEKPQAESVLLTQTIEVCKHSYDLEAWCLKILPGTKELLILSGGDDSQLICSNVDLADQRTQDVDLDVVEVTPVAADQRTHQAGVVALCQPTPPPWQSVAEHLFLTGSYDEHLRLFSLDVLNANPRSKLKCHGELNLGAGVWRISQLDQYPGEDRSREYILLIAGHTGGVFLVRMILTPDSDDCISSVAFTLEKTFVQPDNLVYAVIAKPSSPGHWDTLSSSFYDKRLFNWSWTDPKKPQA